MGVLDDAIREHLDLKRARGADPAEIERMEREALGPVRREPTVSSARFEPVVEEAPPAFHEPNFHAEHEFHEEHPTELEELQELGYHDSTAPHFHPHHDDAHLQHEHLEPHHDFGAAEEPEPPKRRFLRRNRPASLAEPAPLPDPGFHEEQPTEHHELLEHPDSFSHDEPEAATPPPQLRFEHPPKRPRFTAEPPSPQPEPETEEHPQPSDEPVNATPAPAPAHEVPAPSAPANPAAPEYEHFDEPAPEAPEAQETTEFDVQSHMSKPPAEEDEDMLEETPDFLQDTPEHDRLWFEQRPPKDFDFNG